MGIFQLFTKSLYSLKAIAFFRFQKVEKTISYLFALSFFVSLPTFILYIIMLFGHLQRDKLTIFGDALNGFNESQVADLQNSMSGMIPVIAFLSILFIYLTVAMLEFIGVSFIATIGLFIKKAMGRKLNYKQLWVMSAYAVTLPSVIIGISGLLPYSPPAPFLIYLILSILLLFFAIHKVPIPKQKK